MKKMRSIRDRFESNLIFNHFKSNISPGNAGLMPDLIIFHLLRIPKESRQMARSFPAFFLNTYPNPLKNSFVMRDWLKTLIAGVAAYKWGGGCLGSILVFVLVYWLLGHGCN
jgi:hypothetical protein